MPKCPRCGEEIEELRNYCEKSACFYVCLSKAGKLDYTFDCDSDDYTTGVFVCPECDEELFTSEEKALRFLKGEPVE